MMNSFVGSDAEAGGQYLASASSNSASGTFRPFSPARRLFCLLTAFDFLAALVIWILYAHALSQGFAEAIKNEVKSYKFKRSLFDIVLLALWRMILLLLAYALFLSRKWYCVAFTTAITTAFLICKAVFTSFQSPERNNSTLYYVLVLSSLVLAWVEAWVFDVKVIPAETKAEERSQRDERRSLLYDQHPGFPGLITPYSERSFYTPNASDDESEGDEGSATTILSQQDQQFIQKGKETMEQTWHLMGVNEGWKSEKVKDGIVVESRVVPSGRKIFRLKGSLDARAEDVFNLIVFRPQDAPKWGGNVTSSYVVRQIDSHTDIVYNSTGVAGGGMVSCRDFVNLRRWEKRGDVFVSCNASVEVDEVPPKKDHIRGENGPGGWAMREAEDNPNRTEYVWLFDVDLKGWLPQSVIDTALSFMLYSTGQGVKKYVRETLG